MSCSRLRMTHSAQSAWRWAGLGRRRRRRKEGGPARREAWIPGGRCLYVSSSSSIRCGPGITERSLAPCCRPRTRLSARAATAVKALISRLSLMRWPRSCASSSAGRPRTSWRKSPKPAAQGLCDFLDDVLGLRAEELAQLRGQRIRDNREISALTTVAARADRRVLGRQHGAKLRSVIPGPQRMLELDETYRHLPPGIHASLLAGPPSFRRRRRLPSPAQRHADCAECVIRKREHDITRHDSRHIVAGFPVDALLVLPGPPQVFTFNLPRVRLLVIHPPVSQ